MVEVGFRPRKLNFFQRALNWIEGKGRKADAWLNSFSTDIWPRHRYRDEEGGGIMWTSKNHRGGNEMRIGGKNADRQSENVDEMALRIAPTSIVAMQDWGARVEDLGGGALNAIHNIADKHFDHGKNEYDNKRDTIIVIDRDGHAKHDTIQKRDLIDYRQINVHGGSRLIKK